MSLTGGILSIALALFISIAVAAPIASSPKDIEYSRPAGVPLYMDASIPAGAGPFPAVIIVHGGGWVRGNRRIDVEPLFEPLERAGIAWFSIDYRLLKNLTELQAPVEDVQNAILFVKEHASQYRIDPEKIVLIGESAGGQLVAMAALAPKPGARVQGVIAFYAPTDLVALAQDSTLIPEQLRDSLRGTPFEALLLGGLRQVSPIDRIGPGAPPFLLVHGTTDALVPFAQSQAMCDRLIASGSACQLYAIEGGGHGMRWWESSHPVEARKYKTVMVDWLRQELIPR
jgi:acetyl esterase